MKKYIVRYFALYLDFFFFFFFFMKSERNLFFTITDFRTPGVIQGFNLNFNFYLVAFLKGTKLSNNSLILFKNISME